ncbi:MAG: hypothetical protein QOE18_1489 [Chloroflexota bacterium]|nr:hypothetical protein [Chloroflexota bacterium]
MWLPEGEPWPADAAALGMRIGWVFDDAALPIPGGALVWMRGSAAVPVSAQAIAAACAAEPAPQEISADARDVASAEAIAAAGGVPVFGPASLDALIEMLGSFAGRAAVCLPASPGRTDTEAHARLDNVPELAAAARAAPGLGGTLERCQQSVAALRAAGMSELRVRLPATPDLPDVIAQVSALRADALAGLRPGAPRSPDPGAPAGWGGRA